MAVEMTSLHICHNMRILVFSTDHPEIPQATGKVNNIERFDADFFDYDFKQAHTMDPQGRMLLEHAYEAIVDAGVNPAQLRGANTGVFVGACCAESEIVWIYQKLQVRINSSCSVISTTCKSVMARGWR